MFFLWICYQFKFVVCTYICLRFQKESIVSTPVSDTMNLKVLHVFLHEARLLRMINSSVQKSSKILVSHKKYLSHFCGIQNLSRIIEKSYIHCIRFPLGSYRNSFRMLQGVSKKYNFKLAIAYCINLTNLILDLQLIP